MMQAFSTRSLRVDENGEFWILDQHALPQAQNWLPSNTVDELIGHIQSLRVRGAPVIGLAASVLLAVLAAQGLGQAELRQSLQRLQQARPTAVNLMNNLAVMAKAVEQVNYPQALAEAAWQLIQEDQALCAAIADAGLTLVQPESRILTHCNTGSLATAGVGTAIGVLARAHQAKLLKKVWVSETRPLLQGGRLTAWEMGELGIPYQLLCDHMAASLMQRGQVDAVWVGADRIAANGDVANKIGTYNLAVLAQYHKVPFYVAAPSTTLDPQCPNGEAIPIEQRAADEVRGVSGSFGACNWAPDQAPVYNPAFDVTPAALITAWVLDTGVYRQPPLL